MKFTTLIPTTRNDGSEVSEGEIQQILGMFWQRFEGATVEGKTEGFWVDGDQLYKDICLKVSVSCDSNRLAEAETLIKEIGKQLGQLAMFFEVQYFDGVRILKID